MAIQIYPAGKLKFYTGFSTGGLAPFGNSLIISGAIRFLLIRQGGQFVSTHASIADVIAGGVEMTGGGYARQIMGAATIGQSGSSITMTTAPVVFSALPVGNTVVALVLFLNDPAAGTNAAAVPIAWYDGGSFPFDLPKATTGGDFTCNPHPIDGWLKS